RPVSDSLRRKYAASGSRFFQIISFSASCFSSSFWSLASEFLLVSRLLLPAGTSFSCSVLLLLTSIFFFISFSSPPCFPRPLTMGSFFASSVFLDSVFPEA
ncbi:hypothetical protein PanWU01x14_080710, partial [Parasponia andersonii]